MNQHRLQQKRRKRQAKRKAAQITAKRRETTLRAEKARAVEIARMASVAKRMSPEANKPSLFSRVFGGTQITPEQMDSTPAPIVGGGSK